MYFKIAITEGRICMVYYGCCTSGIKNKKTKTFSKTKCVHAYFLYIAHVATQKDFIKVLNNPPKESRK